MALRFLKDQLHTICVSKEISTTLTDASSRPTQLMTLKIKRRGPNFISRSLSTNDAYFTRRGILNCKISHTRSEENPYSLWGIFSALILKIPHGIEYYFTFVPLVPSPWLTDTEDEEFITRTQMCFCTICTVKCLHISGTLQNM